MRTLRPGQQIRQFLDRDGDCYILTVIVAGSSYRSTVTRKDVENLVAYLNGVLQKENHEHTDQDARGTGRAAGT